MYTSIENTISFCNYVGIPRNLYYICHIANIGCRSEDGILSF